MSKLAIDGGTPIRDVLLPYSKQTISALDRRAVENVLLGDWLTTGPMVQLFESAVALYSNVDHGVAVNTGTAALHAAVWASDIGPGDEVIVPAISFVASANCVLYVGATPVFADLSYDTLNIDPVDVESKITPRTKAIIAVDFAGHPADHDALRHVANKHGLVIIEDAAHSLGATYKGKRVGSLQDISTFSFHPVKHITTGEGGMLMTDNELTAKKVRSFRHHGIDLDLHQRSKNQSWQYDTSVLGFNYRIPDINCALGLSQLKQLDGWLIRRREIAAKFTEVFSQIPWIETPTERGDCSSAWHLYVIRLRDGYVGKNRDEVFNALRAENIGVNVHYIPIPWMSHIAAMGYKKGQWPVAEESHMRMITLPLWPGMSDGDVADVIAAVMKVYEAYKV